MATATKIELRKKIGTSFSADGSLLYPLTHKTQVVGLLDSNGKLELGLFPLSTLETKKLVGTINAATNFGTLYTALSTYFADYGAGKTALYPGSYFIVAGQQTISATTDHYVRYGDNGESMQTAVTLENGDHLFFIKYGTESSWIQTGEITEAVGADAALSAYSSPYNALLNHNVWGTLELKDADVPTANGIYGIYTGFRWVPSNVSEYNAQPTERKINKTLNIGMTTTEYDAIGVCVPNFETYDYHQGTATQLVILRIDNGVGMDYWRLAPQVENPPQYPVVFTSTQLTNKYFWGVVNNTYDLATTVAAGLMSAADKIKLNASYNYVHPTGGANAALDLTDQETINVLTVDSAGHVSAASKQSIAISSSSKQGLVELATEAEALLGSDTARAVTAAGLLGAILPYYTDLAAANANQAAHPVGGLVLCGLGTVEI